MARPLVADRRLWVLLAAGALLRLFIGLEAWYRDPLCTSLLSDAAFYDQWARVLALGASFPEGESYWLPPLYPWCLSLLYGALGVEGSGGIGWVITLQAVLGLLATVGIVALGERAIDRRAGLWAGWLWTLYLPVTFFETRLLGVNAAVPLAVARAPVRPAADAPRARRVRRARRGRVDGASQPCCSGRSGSPRR